jgi:hypothetical protein
VAKAYRVTNDLIHWAPGRSARAGDLIPAAQLPVEVRRLFERDGVIVPADDTDDDEVA